MSRKILYLVYEITKARLIQFVELMNTKLMTVRQEISQHLNQNNGKIKTETLVITFGILRQNTHEQQLITAVRKA